MEAKRKGKLGCIRCRSSFKWYSSIIFIILPMVI